LPLFLAEHNWKKEKTPTAIKAMGGAFMELAAGVHPKDWPKTVCLCATYMLPGERAICVWEADKAETLENMFKALRDTFPVETKITPIAQVYPPGPGLYTVIAQLLETAK